MLPDVVFEDEDELQLHQAMYNSQCESAENVANMQAKILKNKADKQKKKDDDEKRAQEARDQKARDDEAAKAKSREKSASKEKSKEPEKVVEAGKDKGKGKEKEVSTEVEKKKKRKTSTKKDGEPSKTKGKKELVAEENAMKRATKSRAKKLDVDRMARELEARMEIAPDEEEASRLALKDRIMDTSLVAYRMASGKSPLVQQKVGDMSTSAKIQMVAAVKQGQMPKPRKAPSSRKKKETTKEIKSAEVIEDEAEEEVVPPAPEPKVVQELIEYCPAEDEILPEEDLKPKHRKGDKGFDDSNILGFPVKVRGRYRCWTCRNPNALDWECCMKIGQKRGKGVCGCCHTRCVKCRWEPKEPPPVIPEKRKDRDDDSEIVAGPSKRSKTTPLPIALTPLPTTITSSASLPPSIIPAPTIPSTDVLVRIETNNLLKSMVEQLKLLNENVSRLVREDRDSEEVSASSDTEVSSLPRTKKKLSIIPEQDEKEEENDEEEGEVVEDGEEAHPSGDEMGEDGSSSGEEGSSED